MVPLCRRCRIVRPGVGLEGAALGSLQRRLRGCVREGDLVARLGGDEFAVLVERIDGLDAAEVFRTSGAELVAGGEAVTVVVNTADHPKCARSWRRVPDVGSDPDYPDLSLRDAQAMRELKAAGRAG